MLLNIKKLENTPDMQEAISVNREILCFFRGVRRDATIKTIDDTCPDGTSLRDHIIQMSYIIHDPINLSALLNRLVKAIGQKKLRGDIDSLYSELYTILLTQKTHIFQYAWDAQGIGNVLYGLQNSSNVPTELFLVIAQVIPGISNWSTQDIGMALYGLQNSSNVPVELLQAFTQVIPRVQSWDAQGIGNALYGISHLEGGEVDNLVKLLFERVESLSIEREGFAKIQSLIIGLNHASIGIPEYIQSRWNELVDAEGRENSITTRQEQDLMEYIQNNFCEDFEFLSGAYVQGHEVDILILDSKGQIFAIIEADGGIHNAVAKKNGDRKRDQYFLREGVTDLLIRVSTNGCRVIESEG